MNKTNKNFKCYTCIFSIVLCKMNNNKATGNDGMTPKMIKCCLEIRFHKTNCMLYANIFAAAINGSSKGF